MRLQARSWIFFLLMIVCPQLVSCTDADPGKVVGPASAPKIVQEPAVAGGFYDAGPQRLSQQVDRMIADGKGDPLDEVWGMVSPHAGYIYSGPVAGSAFKQVAGKPFKTVVVMAGWHGRAGQPNHQLPSVALLDKDAYRTPLGELPIDRELISVLAKNYDFIGVDDWPFQQEHSLEVELPFLQRALSEGYKIVPLIIVRQTEPVAQKLAEALSDILGDRRDVLFVASTDMSHFHDYLSANRMDRKTIQAVVEQDIEGLDVGLLGGEMEMCLPATVFTLLHLNRHFGGEKPQLLDYRNSGDTAGDKRRVVGYMAVAFHGRSQARSGKREMRFESPEDLTDHEKKIIVRFARAVIDAAVRGKPSPEIPDLPRLGEQGAAFVTINTKAGRLRGCIGHVIAHVSLGDCIRQVGKSAALHDRRFSPVTEDELDDLEIEVSVLTAPKRIRDLENVEVGVHGLIMKRGRRQGLLLPQVPVDHHWDKDTFLRQTCRKAGLELDCYSKPSTDIFGFRGIVFDETILQKNQDRQPQ